MPLCGHHLGACMHAIACMDIAIVTTVSMVYLPMEMSSLLGKHGRSACRVHCKFRAAK